MRQPRARTIAVATPVVLVLVVLAALGASALLDGPSRTAVASATIGAPPEEVWAALADLDSYADWNPVVRSASGALEPDASLQLLVARNGEPSTQTEVQVTIVNEGRKLRWNRRTGLPGVRDEEFEVILRPAAAGGTIAEAHDRYEGLLAPFVAIESRRRDLVAILDALRARVESA
jgi:hypothetical protein